MLLRSVILYSCLKKIQNGITMDYFSTNILSSVNPCKICVLVKSRLRIVDVYNDLQ